MPDGIFVNTSSTAPVYYYYTVDIVTNEVLAQIPFADVSYERKIKEPGGFEGVITVTQQTEDLDLYNSTMPGKTALYVTRNGQCVWGGIIWGRTYDLQGRNLSVSASEFTSYLQKRNIWKTYSYKFEAEILKTTKAGTAKVTIKNGKIKTPITVTDGAGKPTKVYVTFSESSLVKYTGYYTMANTADPTQTVFYLNMSRLPAETAAYQNVTVSVKVDTYDYVREMLNDVMIDFSDTNFANETVAPGIKVPVVVSSRVVSNNIVTLTTSDSHGLVEGQVVNIYNLEPTLCGKHIVSEVPTLNQIKYNIPVLTISHVSRLSDTATVYINTLSGEQLVPFVVGQQVIVTSNVTAFNNSGTPVVITETTQNSISYENTGTNVTKTAATGSITVQNLSSAVTNPVNVRVYSREITSTGRKKISSVKRKDGYVYVYTTSNHGFKKSDKVKVSFADISNYKTLNNDEIPVSVLSVSAKMFKYYQPDFTADNKDIKDANGNAVILKDPSKHTAVLATPVKKLKLDTAAIHTLDVGDLVNVRGVDRIDWSRSIYNGFQKISEIDTTEDEASVDVLRVTDFMVTGGTTVTLWTNRSHNVSVGDMVKVSGYTSTLTYLNGSFKVSDVYDLDSAASGVSWIRYKLPTRKTNVSKTANTSGRIAPYGASWFTYEMPEHGATREPDDTISITHVSYVKKNRTVTLTTATRHNCTVGDKITVAVGGKLYDGTYVVTSAWGDADKLQYQLPSDKAGLPSKDVKTEKTTGNFKRVKTKVGYIPTLQVPIDRLGRDNNVATIYSVDHDFSSGDNITVEIYGATYESFENSGEVITITGVTNDTFTYASPGSDVGVKTVTAASDAGRVATLTSAANGFAVGQQVCISKINAQYNGTHTITEVTTNTFKFALTTGSTLTGLSGRAASTINVDQNLHFAYIDYSNVERTLDVTNLSSASNVVTMTSLDHGFAVGDYVLTYVKGKTYKNFRNNNQPVRISAVTTDTFTYTSITGYTTGTVASVAVEGYVTLAPQIEKTPVIISRTYGEFPGNSNMGGLDFSTNDYSSTQYPNDLIRGSDLISVFEHLERYTSNKNGFDYLIECSLVTGEGNKKIFKRTFVLIPRTPETLTDYLAGMPDGKLAVGTYAPPSAFGADQLVFEYPGNIQNISFSENAGNSATRVFVVGNNDDLGSASSARYSASADVDLLNAGWPLLDRVEKVEWPLKGINVVNTDNWGNYDSEADMQLTAERFLRETKPPSGDFIITVNGSLNPEIGTFNPGDWCSIVVRDAFVAQRMASNLEPRSDVIVRKIDGVRVSVPNSPAFPETIDLTLVTEWQVDTIGK